MAGMQNFLKAFDFAHRLDEDAAADSDEDQGFARPRIYKQRSRGLCKYMRLCKNVRRLKDDKDKAVAGENAAVEASAVRFSQLSSERREEESKGRGRYKVWTPLAMLRVAFGHAKKENEAEVEYRKCPTQFTCRSAAFWFRASHTYVQKVRNTVCQLFSSVQKQGVQQTCERTCALKKLQVEMDETAQMLRLRNDKDELGDVDGSFPVFLTRWAASGTWPDFAILHEPIIVPPCVLLKNDVPNTWQALNEKGPVELFEFFKNSQLGLLYFCADRHEVNISLAKLAVKKRPKHVMVVRHHCCLHETHRATSVAITRGGYISEMFCCNAVLRAGGTMRSLLKAARFMMRKNFRVVFDDPREEDRAYAETVLSWTFLQGCSDDDEDIDRNPEAAPNVLQGRPALAQRLLTMLNGDWRSTLIVHHCSLSCCSSNEEAFAKSWSAVRDCLFAERPATPALNRWTSCIEPTRVYLLMMLCHRLLYAAWWKLFWEGKSEFESVGPFFEDTDGRVQPDLGLPLPELQYPDHVIYPDDVEDAVDGPVDGPLDGAELEGQRQQQQEAPLPIQDLDDFLASVPDDADTFRRPERVRAKRAGSWIAKPLQFIEDMYITILATFGTVRLLYYWLRDQRRASWSGACGMEEVPLVQLVMLSRSPVVWALEGYKDMMELRPDAAMFILSRLPGVDLQSAKDKLFQSVVTVQGELWKNQVHVYQRYPWKLVRAVHPITSQEEREQIYESVMSPDLEPCDCDPGFTLPLKQTGVSLGIFLQQLTLLACSKVTNVEVETNFARATSARAYMRGRKHGSGTMACKHVLAEMVHQHCLAFPPKRRRQLGNSKRRSARRAQPDFSDSRAAFSRRVLRAISAGAGADLVQVEEQTAGGGGRGLEKRQKSNGWLIFRQNRLDSRPALFGESRADRVRRVIREAAADFKLPAYAAEKHKCSLLAKERNKANKALRASGVGKAVPALSQLASLSPGLGPGADTAPSHSTSTVSAWRNQHHGPWGASDKEWPLSRKILEDRLFGAGRSVARFSNEWMASNSHPIAPTKQCVDDSSGLTILPDEVSFCQKLGGCFYKCTVEQQELILHRLGFCRNMVRHLRIRNDNASAAEKRTLRAPLVVLASEAQEPPDEPSVYLLCKPNFRPYDVLFWRCKVHPLLSATQCSNVHAPESFDAELLWTEYADSGGKRQLCPDLRTMHQFAYDMRDVPKSVLSACKLVVDYQVSEERMAILHLRRLGFSSTATGIADVPGDFIKKKGGASETDEFLKAANHLLSVCKGALKHNRGGKDVIPFDPSASVAGSVKKRKPINVNKEPSLRDLKRHKGLPKPNPRITSAAPEKSEPCALAIADLGNSSGDGEGDPEDSGSENSEGGSGGDDEIDARRQWLRALDLQDPSGDIGRADADVDPKDPAAAVSQNPDGKVHRVSYVYDEETGIKEQKTALGSINQLSGGTSKSRIKIQCYLHTKCQVFRNVHEGVDERARQWLLHGWHTYKFRNEGAKHMADAHKFLGQN